MSYRTPISVSIQFHFKLGLMLPSQVHVLVPHVTYVLVVDSKPRTIGCLHHDLVNRNICVADDMDMFYL